MMPDRARHRSAFARALVLSVCAAISPSACGAPDGAAADTSAVRDSVGVRIVEAGRPSEQWRVSAEPDVRIGTIDGEPPYLLSRVSFAGRLEDGRIVVADGAALEIRYFEPDGRHRATVGRPGEGPGEFVAFGNVTMGPGDTLWIRDARSPRITVVSPGEAVVREYPVASLDQGSGLRLVGPVGSGRIATTTRATPSLPPDLGSEPTYLRDTLSLSMLDLEALEVVPVATVPATERVISMERGAAGGLVRITLGTPAFAYDAHHAVLGSGILFGSSDQPELRVTDGSGRLTQLIRLADRDLVLVSEILDRYLAWREENARGRGHPDPAADVRGERARLDLLPEGHVVPLFDVLRTDVADRIWLRDYPRPWDPDGPRVWSVYASNGRPIARVQVPPDLNVLHFGREHVTGVVRDELDVEYVVVHRIEKGP